MRFISYDHNGAAVPGVLSRDGLRAAPLWVFPGMERCDSLLSLIRTECELPEQLLKYAAGEWMPPEEHLLAELSIAAPIPRPLHELLCVGVNYREHRQECSEAMPLPAGVDAVYFSKRALKLTGPGEHIPAHTDLDRALDYEVELAVILGRGGRDIKAEDALSHVFGYSIANDVSARALQKRHGQWLRGKSLDGFSVLGPCIVTPEELTFPLRLESRVNGELRQSASTADMLRDVSALICELSAGMTLEAGDIILTGTPSGVGLGFDPPRYLRPGDEVTCTIQGIGTLSNSVRE